MILHRATILILLTFLSNGPQVMRDDDDSSLRRTRWPNESSRFFQIYNNLRYQMTFTLRMSMMYEGRIFEISRRMFDQHQRYFCVYDFRYILYQTMSLTDKIKHSLHKVAEPVKR